MYEDYRRELLVAMCGLLDDQETLLKVIGAIDNVSQNYSIEPKVTALVPANQLTAEVVKMYLATCRVEGQSQGTIGNKFYCLSKFFDTVHSPLADITTNDIRSYLFMVSETVSENRAEKVRQYLNRFFNYCIDEEILTVNPCKRIKKIRLERTEIKPLKDDELTQLRGAVNTSREKCIIEVMYSTGCRISELSGIKIADLDFENHEVHLLGKGKKHRTAFLSDTAVESCKEYLTSRNDDCPYLIISERGQHKMGTHHLRDVIHNISARCGLYINPHQIRHTTATNLQREMPIQNISKYLGHANISTTMIYAEINRNEMKKEFMEVMQ